MFDSLTALENFFAVCAILGGTGFVVWLVLNLIGIGSEVSADADAHIDVGHVDGSTDLSFKILSFHGITGFLMMFGLIGLAMSKSNTGNPLAILGAVGAGVGSVWVITMIFNAAKRLQSSGTIDMRDTEGQPGLVYLTIPKEGTGKVQVTVRTKMMELNAVAEDGGEIRTGERIRVIRYVSGNTVSVEKATPEKGKDAS